MARQTGAIEDLVADAKSRYFNVEDQAEYIQSFIDFIKSNQSDKIKTMSLTTTYGGYDYQLTIFNSNDVVYIWYNIYLGPQKKASKLESMPVKEMLKYLNQLADEQLDGSTRVLFCSNSEFSSPVFSVIAGTI